VASTEEVRAQALEVAAGWSPPDAPGSWSLTAALFRVIAGHEPLLERLALLPPGRLPALTASAALSFLVRRDGPEPLAGYFPQPGAPQPAFDARFFPAARAFITARLDEIAAICRQRRYQMNEVARCTQIALGIAAVAPGAAEPVGLIDLGTGAGFGLHLDRYRYQAGPWRSGSPDAALTLTCEARGPHMPPASGLPAIAERAGIDVNPVDVGDAAARTWLQACAPPEASALARLDAAMEVARHHPAKIIAGDVADVLPGVLDSFPPGRHVFVTDAYLAVFLPPDQRARLADILATAGRSRQVTWLSLDPLVPLGPSGRHSVQGLALPRWLIRDYQQQGVFAVLSAQTWPGRPAPGYLLARAHPSGRWVEWLAAGTPDAGVNPAITAGRRSRSGGPGHRRS
jgi:hypothetical protein